MHTENNMGRKVNIGITSDYFKDGRFILPGPGLSILDGMSNVKYSALPGSANIENQNFNTNLVLPDQIRGFDMIASIAPKWDASSFDGNENFLSVHRHGAGFDMVNVRELSESGILLCTTPEAVKRPMAVVILTYLLLLSTRYPIKNSIAREGRWGDIPKYPGYGLVGKTFGCIGAGRIAREAFEIARPLGMEHIAYDPYLTGGLFDSYGIKLVDMDTVLRESDYLSISCPLNESTRHLIGEKEIAKMKPGAFLINAARGPIVDENALITALQVGVIQGAGIDVFEKEPPAADNPLFHMDNVAVTPHALGWTDQAVMGIWAQIIDQMSCIMCGKKPTGIVNIELWDKPEFQNKLNRFLDETRHV
jgi:phosphoglycerate dehydrogenase-like enzyme